MSMSITVLRCNFDSTESPASLNHVSFLWCDFAYTNMHLEYVVGQIQ
jgi:hypothetical protein